MKALIHRMSALMTLAVLVSAATWGQSPAQSDPPAPREKHGKGSDAPAKKHKMGQLEVSGSWRLRVEGWDWFEGRTGNSNYPFAHSLFRVALGQEASRFDWKLEAAQIMILGLPSGSVLAAPQGQLGLGGSYLAANGGGANNVNGFVKQAFVRFKLRQRTSLQLGRFEYLDGTEVAPKDSTLAAMVQTRIAQRLIGPFGFSAVGRSFDGVEVSQDAGRCNLTFVGVRPTRGVYQIDAMGELDVDMYYGAFTVPVEFRHSAGELRVFGLGYVDHRRLVIKTDNRSQSARAADHGMIQIGTYGADYLHVFNTAAAGKFDFLVWGAIQTGSWGNLSQRAGAFVAEIGWQPPVKPLKPWLSAGFSYGSGDRNPADSVHGTFFQGLPTPRPYARFPFYNMENNEDLYASLNLRPHPKLALRSELHGLRLSQAADLWYLGGGAFQPKTFGYTGRPSGGHQSLASVWDISADYQVTRPLGFTLYYGHGWGRSVIGSTYPRERDANFAYVETNYRF